MNDETSMQQQLTALTKTVGKMNSIVCQLAKNDKLLMQFLMQSQGNMVHYNQSAQVYYGQSIPMGQPMPMGQPAYLPNFHY